jgi:hypothetical protein
VTGLVIVMRKVTSGFIGLVPPTAAALIVSSAGRAEPIARAMSRLRLRFGGKVLGLGDHHRDVQAAGGLAADGDGRVVRGDD